MGHDRSRSARSGDVFAADGGALNIVPENDAGLYVFVAVAVLHAVLRAAPAVLDVGGTAPRVVGADQ